MDYEVINLADAGPELASAPFETHARMTQIAMAERPMDFIADEVMPRVPSAYKFRYTKGRNEDQFSIPDNRASRAGRLTEVEFGADLADGSTDDYGLIAFVPERDIDEATRQNSAWDPVQQASSGLGQLQYLAREQRVAQIVFAQANYPANNRQTLAGGDQWSNAASDPLKEILEALDVCITRPNSLVLGQPVWTKLRIHPVIVEATVMSGAGRDKAAGAASKQAVADLLELDRILVGKTFHNAARRGRDPDYRRLWGNHAALLHIRRPTSTQDEMPTWGFTAEAMGVDISTSQEPSRGVGRGSRAIKISECIREIVSWETAGYFFQNAIA